MSKMEELLLMLMIELEKIGKSSQEIYDTECREQMGGVIWNGFIIQKKNYNIPERFGLFSDEANLKVKEAISKYIKEAIIEADKSEIDTPVKRLNEFQNHNVKTPDEEQYPDDFFGWIDPNEINWESL